MAITITLAGEEIEVHELPVRKNLEWRKRAVEGPLAAEQQFMQAGNTIRQAFDGYVADLLIAHGATVLDLVLDFLPDQSKREYYADRAKESEVLKAFLDLSRLALASDFFTTTYGPMFAPGSPAPTTGTSLPEASGESG